MAFKYALITVSNPACGFSAAVPGNFENWEQLTAVLDSETINDLQNASGNAGSDIVVSNMIHWVSMEDMDMHEATPLEKMWLKTLKEIPQADECIGNWKIPAADVFPEAHAPKETFELADTEALPETVEYAQEEVTVEDIVVNESAESVSEEECTDTSNISTEFAETVPVEPIEMKTEEEEPSQQLKTTDEPSQDITSGETVKDMETQDTDVAEPAQPIAENTSEEGITSAPAATVKENTSVCVEPVEKTEDKTRKTAVTEKAGKCVIAGTVAAIAGVAALLCVVGTGILKAKKRNIFKF